MLLSSPWYPTSALCMNSGPNTGCLWVQEGWSQRNGSSRRSQRNDNLWEITKNPYTTGPCHTSLSPTSKWDLQAIPRGKSGP